MYSRMLVLRFPKAEVEQPIVCFLASDFNLTFNILKATILPRKEGVMVMELSGTRKSYNQGVKYLREHGVKVQAADQDIKRNNSTCTHCGACTAVCPTGALTIKRPEMRVDFRKKKCSVCGLCVAACPPRAMEVRTIGNMVLK